MGEKRPFFSIIIPTYNRPRQLHECLKSIERVEFPKKRFEVIVVRCPDRLARRSAYQVLLLEEMMRASIEVHFC